MLFNLNGVVENIDAQIPVEIPEERRRLMKEKIKRLVKKAAAVVILLVLGVILGGGGVIYYQNWQAKEQGAYVFNNLRPGRYEVAMWSLVLKEDKYLLVARKSSGDPWRLFKLHRQFIKTELGLGKEETTFWVLQDRSWQVGVLSLGSGGNNTVLSSEF